MDGVLGMGCQGHLGWGCGTFKQKPKSVGALYCLRPVIREKTLQSSRSASSCRCLGSCEKP